MSLGTSVAHKPIGTPGARKLARELITGTVTEYKG